MLNDLLLFGPAGLTVLFLPIIFGILHLRKLESVLESARLLSECY